jgi:hypothetical protein
MKNRKKKITRAETILVCSEDECRAGTRMEYKVEGLTKSQTVNDSYPCSKCGKRAFGTVHLEVKP